MYSNITLNQFNNILAFLAIIVPNEQILTCSPDYIIEKFERYIGDVKMIHDSGNHKVGMHPNLRKQIIDAYHARWNPLARQLKINEV
jgi:hypothetical protein